MQGIPTRFVAPAVMASALMASLSAGPAFSAISVFTNRSAWQTAVGSFILQDFELFNGVKTGGAGADIGDFTVQQVGTDFGGIFSEISKDVSITQSALGGSLVSGSVAVGGATSEEGSGVLLAYDAPINAWGADLGGFSDNRQSAIAVSILGVSHNIAYNQGFFGLISYSAFTNINVTHVSGLNDGFGLDNVSYASISNSNSVPGPLPVFGAVAAFGCSRKLRQRIKDSKLPMASTI